jgi:hypothetical protein
MTNAASIVILDETHLGIEQEILIVNAMSSSLYHIAFTLFFERYDYTVECFHAYGDEQIWATMIPPYGSYESYEIAFDSWGDFIIFYELLESALK